MGLQKRILKIVLICPYKNFTPAQSRDEWRGRRERLLKARARWFWRSALDRVLHDGPPSRRCIGRGKLFSIQLLILLNI